MVDDEGERESVSNRGSVKRPQRRTRRIFDTDDSGPELEAHRKLSRDVKNADPHDR